MDNRYSSLDLFLHLKRRQNAFGTVRMGRNYLPADSEKIFQEAKDYKPGEYQTRYSKKAGLVYEVIQSNNRVRALCTTDETELE